MPLPIAVKGAEPGIRPLKHVGRLTTLELQGGLSEAQQGGCERTFSRPRLRIVSDRKATFHDLLSNSPYGRGASHSHLALLSTTSKRAVLSSMASCVSRPWE